MPASAEFGELEVENDEIGLAVTRLGRPAPRLRLDLTARFVVGTQSPRPARVINLSHTGCYLATPEPPEVGARVRLLIAPPEAMGPEMMTAECWGEAPARF